MEQIIGDTMYKVEKQSSMNQVAPVDSLLIQDRQTFTTSTFGLLVVLLWCTQRPLGRIDWCGVSLLPILLHGRLRLGYLYHVGRLSLSLGNDSHLQSEYCINGRAGHVFLIGRVKAHGVPCVARRTPRGVEAIFLVKSRPTRADSSG